MKEGVQLAEKVGARDCLKKEGDFRPKEGQGETGPKRGRLDRSVIGVTCARLQHNRRNRAGHQA